MKLKELAGILKSTRDGIQSTIVWDRLKMCELEHGCSVEYAFKNYGDNRVERISAEDNILVIEIV